MKVNEMRFDKNLKALREIHKITQQQLADRLHISRQAISMWENDRGKPDILCLNSICNYFDISADQIMHGNIISPNKYKTLDDGEYEEKTVFCKYKLPKNAEALPKSCSGKFLKVA